MDDRAALSVALADLVRNVAGVSVVFSSAPAIAAMVSHLAPAEVAAAQAEVVAAQAEVVAAPAEVLAAQAEAVAAPLEVGGEPVGVVPVGAAAVGAAAVAATTAPAPAQSHGRALLEGISAATNGVQVRDDADGLAVSLTIGVAEGAPAAVVCRAVYDVIADYLVTAADRPASSIAVKVGRIG